ncbi:MAG: hypothetical protein A3F72_19155 [Bacteroidetes bacterium RIFCSPLOWO2_12_FULL_35_15]|nr:MAG: hypothetical protein A3F72_19155 [Bacteroidetes bacterium RIFCSPLOWO2_12_FULL_35_15]
MKTPKLFLILLLTTTSAIAQTAIIGINPCAATHISAKTPIRAVNAAQASLMDNYDVKFVHLDIDVERTSTYISGNVRSIASVTSITLDTFGFELHPDLLIDSVIVNGVTITPVRTGNFVTCGLPSTLITGATIDAKTYYHGTPPNGGAAAIGNGFTNDTSPSWGNQVTYSLSQPYSAYEWWPCKQTLYDKIDSSYVYVTTDSTNKAGSNGLLTNVVDLGNGKKRYEWKERHVIDNYLISVSVAKYVDYSIYANPANSPQPILIQNYVYDNPATLTNFQAEIDQTKDLLELYSNLYGLYPFWDEKYGHCMAPFSGGMEHQTMTSLGFFDFSLIAHELGHQWFGDNVTCATWSDIWVNEGFASYSEYVAYENLDPANAAGHMNSQHTNVMSQPGGSIWFTDTTDVNRIFDSRLTYDKGSAMIHSIRFEVNDDSVFFLVLRTYMQQYKDNVATALNFKTVLETVSGKNFTTFFNQWFYGEGYPTFNVKWNQTGGNFFLKSTETVSMASVTSLFVTPLEYKLTRSIGDTIIKVNQTQAAEFYTLSIPGTVTAITVDPNNWILNKVIGPIHDLTLTDIHENDNQVGIEIYPNPATDKLFINISKIGPYNVAIYDITGKIVKSQTVSQNEIIDLSTIESGLYFVKISDGKNVILKVSKLVKE